jgi:ATP-dependent DNA helicase 2 subunit 2
MDEEFSEGCSRAKMALECCKLTLQQKLFNNATHELGLILFGDSESDDGNSLLLQALEKPRLDLVRKVQQLGEARFDSPRPGGDIFSAVSFALGQINDHCGKKKYNKRIFLFTSGMGETDFDAQDVRTLAGRLAAADVKLNLVPIDFMTSYNADLNELEGEMFMESAQERNA